MGQKQAVLNATDQAICRVKNLFSRDQKNFIQTLIQKSNQPREYDYVKMPRLLPKQPKIPLKEKAGEGLSKKQISCAHHSNCSLSPRYLMHLIMNNTSAPSLKVKNLHLKEYLLAQRNFQKIGKEMHEWVTSYLKDKIKLIPKDNKQQNKDTLPWEDFLKHKEERQFLITRVIKYLLD